MGVEVDTAALQRIVNDHLSSAVSEGLLFVTDEAFAIKAHAVSHWPVGSPAGGHSRDAFDVHANTTRKGYEVTITNSSGYVGFIKAPGTDIKLVETLVRVPARFRLPSLIVTLEDFDG